LRRGEGFAIAAIQCSLIEFLESTLQGKNYRYVKAGDPPIDPQFEYSGSRQMFVDFLLNRAPFSKEFTSPVAHDFYESVRCGLVHEARTKGDWLIRAKAPAGTRRCIDPARKLLYRDNFHDALLTFIGNYEADLLNSNTVQDAFIRKYDALCRP